MMTFFKRDWLVSWWRCLALILVAAGLYGGVLQSPFVFDDSRIYNNPHLRLSTLSVKPLAEAVVKSEPRTRPVANLSFALNYFVHHYRVVGYHLVNIVVHALTGILLFWVLSEMLSQVEPKTGGRASLGLPFVAALIWLAHPVQTQAVTYIVQRMTSLAALFSLLALLFYIKARSTPKTGWKILGFGGSLFAVLLALGSKETAVLLPFFIFLYEWYFLQDLKGSWLKRAWPYPVALFFLLGLIGLAYLDWSPVGAVLGSYQGRDFSLAERLLTQPRVVIFYLSLLFFPHPSRLNLNHDFPAATSLFTPFCTSLALVVMAVLFGLAVYTARRQRVLSFALLWFLGNLLIESSFIGLEMVYEHRLYLPSMMVVAALVLLVDRGLGRYRLVKILLTLGICLTLAWWTHERNLVWRDRISLWGDCVAKSPAKARPHNNLAVALKKAGHLEAAIVQYQETIRLDPEFFEAYNNLGNIMMLLGRLGEAINSYEQAVALQPGQPLLHVNLGRALEADRRYLDAYLHYAEALRLRSGDPLLPGHFLRVKRILGR